MAETEPARYRSLDEWVQEKIDGGWQDIAKGKTKAVADRIAASLNQEVTITKVVCAVCFHDAWVLIEAEEECGLDHPHDGEHARCDYCCLQKLYLNQAEAAKGLVRQLAGLLNQASSWMEDWNADYQAAVDFTLRETMRFVPEEEWIDSVDLAQVRSSLGEGP